MLPGKTLHLEATTPDETLVRVAKALGSLPRLRIMRLLAVGGRSVGELAEALELPTSTVAAQIKVLEDAKFVHTELQPASHGLQKVCTRSYDNVVLQLPLLPANDSESSTEISMPIGAYTAFEAAPTCGLASETSLIGYLDDPLSFYEPERVHADLIWFRSGYLEYSFPNRLPETALPTRLVVSMELCSEAPLHNNAWPSDITLWLNGCEVGTWTCPGDFGGHRGQLTPTWWSTNDSQYGVLKRWQIGAEGSFVDAHPLSSLTIAALALEQERLITVRIGVKEDALHRGGLNLFGRSFGNYPQDLTLRLDYLPGRLQDDQATAAPRRKGRFIPSQTHARANTKAKQRSAKSL